VDDVRARRMTAPDRRQFASTAAGVGERPSESIDGEPARMKKRGRPPLDEIGTICTGVKGVGHRTPSSRAQGRTGRAGPRDRPSEHLAKTSTADSPFDATNERPRMDPDRLEKRRPRPGLLCSRSSKGQGSLASRTRCAWSHHEPLQLHGGSSASIQAVGARSEQPAQVEEPSGGRSHITRRRSRRRTGHGSRRGTSTRGRREVVDHLVVETPTSGRSSDFPPPRRSAKRRVERNSTATERLSRTRKLATARRDRSDRCG